MADESKDEKKDFSTAIMDKKKAPNRLIVDESTGDDNSVRIPASAAGGRLWTAAFPGTPSPRPETFSPPKPLPHTLPPSLTSIEC